MKEPPEGGKKSVRPRPAENAFDLWLNRSLQELYGEIAKEAVPEELLKLIENDRKK